MNKNFAKALQHDIQVAYEQGFREGAHRAIMEERKQRHEKKLRTKLKRRIKRDQETA